jgi:predicted enzyme related to lactoylglutathione lyase
MNPVVYFEIPVSNMERACLFYEGVFKVSLEAREIDGNEMALFPYVDGQPGASGALARGSAMCQAKPGHASTSV